MSLVDMRHGAGFICCYIALISLMGAGAAAAGDEKAEAKERFEKGVSLFKDEDFEAALVEFRAAYNAKPHFAVRYNVGICLFKLHRYTEAALELKAYLEEGGKKVPKGKKKEVRAILKELESLVGTLMVTCPVEGAEVWVDGEYRGKVPFMVPLKLDVGQHRVEVSAEGYETEVKTVDVPGGKEVSVEFELEESEEETVEPEPEGKKKLNPAIFWSGVGLTGGISLIAIITGSVALKREKEYARMEYTDDWQSFRTSTRQLTIATDLLWGLAGASLISTIIVAFYTDFGRKKDETPEVGLSPPVLGPGGLVLEGRF